MIKKYFPNTNWRKMAILNQNNDFMAKIDFKKKTHLFRRKLVKKPE
jgi:hypothetical protein